MITAEQLREILNYDPATGVFTWKVARRGGINAGDMAGCRSASGHHKIGIDGRDYYSHRLAFLWMKREVA